MFTGIRWDEHGARENETYFSERANPKHTRIHPLLHFTEREIWDATFALDIPYTSLYNQGYRSLDTKHGTLKSSDSPAWKQDLENTSERETRSKEKEKMMKQLRAWGYI
jgi:phosphoadenosine phosphosulfate reductase